MTEARHDRLTVANVMPGPGAHVIDGGGALFAKRAVYGHDAAEDAEGPVIRLIGDARFSKVAVHRGAFDPMAPRRQWQDLRHAR